MTIYFTPQDVNQILAEVSGIFSQIVNQRNKIILLQEELQRIISNGSKFSLFISKKQELNKSVTQLYKMIEKLEDSGVMIKSVEEGLLDFPSLRFDEEVWLCWKYGEARDKILARQRRGFHGKETLDRRKYDRTMISSLGIL